MKGNKKMLVASILLLLISAGLTTYAIYRSAVTATGTVTAAAWNVEFKDNTTTITDNYTLTFGAADCVNSHVASGKIAPGATCNKTVTLDATGTEVDVQYTVTPDNANIVAEKNNSTLDTTSANQFTATIVGGGTGTITYDAASQTASIVVSLAWAGQDDDPTNTINSADTFLNGATIKVPLTLVATQVPVSGS